MLEQELKLTAEHRATLDQVIQWRETQQRIVGVPDLKPVRFFAVYYDTRDRRLEQQHLSLRARLEGDRWRAAFKLKGEMVDGLSQREEFECDITGELTSPNDLPQGKVRSSVCRFLSLETPLDPVVMVDMQRTIIDLAFDQCEVEMVLDSGIIKRNERQVSLNEVELELKSGRLDRLIEFGERLRTRFGLRRSTRTKHRIGLEL